ncbi:MAG TPA: allantoicase [Streptosporangiaceae bacterium]|nr:allantoicase [Streptosporangiaceae bacterium]
MNPAGGALDLASRWLGASVVAASDESFGFKENLLVPADPAFVPGRYDHRGEIVDGWETRRRRGEPGHDWAIIRLGVPGVISDIDVDTSFFTGNFPPACRVEALGAEGYPSPAELASHPGWTDIVPRRDLAGDQHNVFPVADAHRFTHVRLSIYPDGGVARLRVHGQAVPDPRLWDGLTVDLASQEHGGLVVASSDSFYTSAALLNRPDRARTMGEGWETSRRRNDGHDFAVIRLGVAGLARQAVIDTAHFKYNASAEVVLSGHGGEPVPGPGREPGMGRGAGPVAGPGPEDGWAADRVPGPESPDWFPLLPRTRLQPDTRHVFGLAESAPVSWLRVDAYPDGGISRVRLTGVPDPAARRTAGLRWFNALPDGQAAECLAGHGLDDAAIAAAVAARPLTTTAVAGLPDENARHVLSTWIIDRQAASH